MARIFSHQRKLRSMNSVEVNPYFKTMYCFCAIFCIQRLVCASILPFLPNFDRHQHVPYFVRWCRHSRSYDFYGLILVVPALKVTIWKMVPVRLTYNNYDKRNTCVGNKEKFEDAKEISRSRKSKKDKQCNDHRDTQCCLPDLRIPTTSLVSSTRLNQNNIMIFTCTFGR